MAIDPNHTATATRPLRPIAPAPPPPPPLYTVPIRAQSSPAAAVVYPGRSPYPSGPPPLNFHSQPHPHPYPPPPVHLTAPAYNLHQSPLSPPLKVSSTPEVRFSVSCSLPPSFFSLLLLFWFFGKESFQFLAFILLFYI